MGRGQVGREGDRTGGDGRGTDGQGLGGRGRDSKRQEGRDYFLNSQM